MKKIRAIIVDDDEQCIKSLATLLEKDPRIEITATFNNPTEAVTGIVMNKPDILFLDIQMPVKSGFDIISDIRNAGIEPPVIFVTAYDKFAIEAIRSAAFDYLLKPVNERELSYSLERFISSNSVQESESRYVHLLEQVAGQKKIKFNTNGGFILVDPEEIIYIKADWNYSEIHLKGGKTELVTINLGSVEKSLPENLFMRINRSIIINISFLTRVKRITRSVTLTNDSNEYSFKIPLTKIRILERKL